MKVCPICDRSYPEGDTHCDHDGSILIPDAAPGLGQGASIDVSLSDAFEISPATRAESPSGRQRLGSQPATMAGRPELGGAQDKTRYDNGTRVSTGTPPAMPGSASGHEQPKSKAATKRDEAKIQAQARCGEVLGSYRLQSVIGFGGMGAVYTAEHIKLGRHVALKLLHPQFAARHEAVVRFFQEAQAVNRIRHKNIVDVTDLVELDDGTAFIIMELLDGESLGARLRRLGLLGTGPTLSVLIQICDGLSAAHSVDIVHRDLKPDNIFITKNDDDELLVKLLDFGVAKLVGKASEMGLQTAAGSVVGTPAFMSPEQAGGLAIDRRSDLYSLGAIMYQLFTGQHVFRGKSFGDYVKLHLNQEPVPPRQTPGGVAMDPELEHIVMRCLNKSPTARFQSAADLRVALVDYMALFAERNGASVHGDSGIYRLSGIAEGAYGRPPQFSAPPSTISVGSAEQVHPETALMVGDLPGHADKHRRPLVLALGASAALIVVIGIAVAVSKSGAASDSTPDPTVQPILVTTLPQTTPLAPEHDAAPTQATVRIESNVLAQIFDDGQDVARCGTPCEIEIDVSSGVGDRTFEVRAKGYETGEVVVDLRRPRTRYRVELPAVEPVIVAETGDSKTGSKTGDKTGSKTGDKAGSKTGDKAGSKTGNKTGNKDGNKDGSSAVPADHTLDPFKKKRSR